MGKVSSSNSQGVHVPKLRFRDGSGKEFPPYCQESVGTLFYHISRRNNEMANKNVITNSAEFGLIHQRLFFDKDIAVEGNTEKYYIIEQGDFVYNPRKSTTAPYGPFNCYQGDEEGIVSPLYTCLKPLHKEFTNYLLWYFRSSAWYSYVYHNGAQGGARHDRVGMTNELMDGIPVNLPCLEEQEKVSKFLSLIEQRIEKQRQLVEALKSYKRGALSKLFPQNGKSTPQYRFAGFTDLWEQRKLIDEVFSVDTGKSKFSLSNVGEYEVLGSTSVIGYDSSYDYEGEFILTARVGANAGELYRHSGKVKISDNTVFIQGKQLDFIYYALLNFDIKRLSFGTGQPLVKASELKNQIIRMPISEMERESVGAFFRHLDRLITLHQRKLSKFEDIKAGLLQQLFI